MDKINILIYILILLFIALLVYYFHEKGKLLEGMTTSDCNYTYDDSEGTPYYTYIIQPKTITLENKSSYINLSVEMNTNDETNILFNYLKKNNQYNGLYFSYTGSVDTTNEFIYSSATKKGLITNGILELQKNMKLSSENGQNVEVLINNIPSLQKGKYDPFTGKLISSANILTIPVSLSPTILNDNNFDQKSITLENGLLGISYLATYNPSDADSQLKTILYKCPTSSPGPASSNTPPPATAPAPSPSSCGSYFTDTSSSGPTYNYIIQPNKLEVSDYVYVPNSSNQSYNAISHVTLTLTMNNLLEATNLYTSIYNNNSPKNITFYVATTNSENINNTFYNSKISKNKEVILSKKWVNPLKLAVPPIYNNNEDPTTFLNQNGRNITVKIAASANSKEFILNNPLIGISSTEKMDTMNSLLYGCISPSSATTSSAPLPANTSSSSPVSPTTSPMPAPSPYTYIIDQIDNCPNNDRFVIYFDDGTTSKSYIKLYSTRGSISIINTTNQEDAQKFYFCKVKLSSESTINMILTDFNGKKYYLRAFSGLKIELIDELTTISKTTLDSEIDFSDAKTLKKFTREYNEKMIKFVIDYLNNNSHSSSPTENSGSISPSCPDQKNSNYIHGLPLLNIHYSNVNKMLQ